MSDDVYSIAQRYYLNDHGNAKQRLYWELYESILAHRKDEPIKLLELGVHSASSMLIWKEYLPKATIVGFDISPKPPLFPDSPRIHFVQGDQSNFDDLRKAADIVGGQFDMIVDDASHVGWLTRESFRGLFDNHLVDGGHYIIEDIGASLHANWQPDGAQYKKFNRWERKAPRKFDSYRTGIIGAIKQLQDHLYPEAEEAYSIKHKIKRIDMHPHIAVIYKED